MKEFLLFFDFVIMSQHTLLEKVISCKQGYMQTNERHLVSCDHIWSCKERCVWNTAFPLGPAYLFTLQRAPSTIDRNS